MEAQPNKPVKTTTLKKVEPNYLNKKRFELYGIVKLITPDITSVLISRTDTGTPFWADCSCDFSNIKAGDKCKFEITISTFVGSDDFIKTKLRAVSVTVLDDSAHVPPNSLDGHMAANVVNWVETDTRNLYVLTLRRMQNDQPIETYHMRYYYKGDPDKKREEREPKLGTAIIKFDLMKSYSQINTKGQQYSRFETREYTNEEGENVKVESPVYVPTLTIKEIIR